MGSRNIDDLRRPPQVLLSLLGENTNFQPKPVSYNDLEYRPYYWFDLTDDIQTEPTAILAREVGTVSLKRITKKDEYLQFSSEDRDNIYERLRLKMMADQAIYVARNIFISRAGSDGGFLVLSRRRNGDCKFPGLLEPPGGKLKKNRKPDSHSGTPALLRPTIKHFIDQARTELTEEIGDFIPTDTTKKGVCIAMAEYRGSSFLEVAEVSVVKPQTLMSIAQLANGRTKLENPESKENHRESSPWLCLYYPYDVVPERFLPTTRLSLSALVGAQAWVDKPDYKGIGIFLPYLDLSSDNRVFGKWYRTGERINLWDLNLSGIYPARMPVLRPKN